MMNKNVSSLIRPSKRFLQTVQQPSAIQGPIALSLSLASSTHATSQPRPIDNKVLESSTLQPNTPRSPISWAQHSMPLAMSSSIGKAKPFSFPQQQPIKPLAPAASQPKAPGTVAGPAATTATATPAPAPRRKLRPRKAAITLSSNAISHLRKLLDSPQPKLIRIGVKNRGCSGLSYHLEYVDEPGKFDEKIQQDGVTVLIDSKALFSIIGSEMDWKDDKLSSRFVFHNPNIKGECGCGESFMV